MILAPRFRYMKGSGHSCNDALLKKTGRILSGYL
jgi:hypothetical protein